MDKMKEEVFGPHLMVDILSADAGILGDLSSCFEYLSKIPALIGMTPITQPYIFPYKGLIPDDEGITGFIVIAESHISIHTFPKKNYAFIDIFSCKEFDVDLALKYTQDHFKIDSTCMDVKMEKRGLAFKRGSLT